MQRRTRQRDAVRAVLETAGRPLNAREILRAARRACPTLGLATVYRALRTWQNDGWLTVVEFPGAAPAYELADKPHHHHFHCRVCARVFELPGCAGDLRRLLPRGYRLERHDVVLYGICAGCE